MGLRAEAPPPHPPGYQAAPAGTQQGKSRGVLVKIHLSDLGSTARLQQKQTRALEECKSLLLSCPAQPTAF